MILGGSFCGGKKNVVPEKQQKDVILLGLILITVLLLGIVKVRWLVYGERRDWKWRRRPGTDTVGVRTADTTCLNEEEDDDTGSTIDCNSTVHDIASSHLVIFGVSVRVRVRVRVRLSIICGPVCSNMVNACLISTCALHVTYSSLIFFFFFHFFIIVKNLKCIHLAQLPSAWYQQIIPFKK